MRYFVILKAAFRALRRNKMRATVTSVPGGPIPQPQARARCLVLDFSSPAQGGTLMAIVENDPIDWTKLARDWPKVVAKKAREIAAKRRKDAERAAKKRR